MNKGILLMATLAIAVSATTSAQMKVQMNRPETEFHFVMSQKYEVVIPESTPNIGVFNIDTVPSIYTNSVLIPGETYFMEMYQLIVDESLSYHGGSGGKCVSGNTSSITYSQLRRFLADKSMADYISAGVDGLVIAFSLIEKDKLQFPQIYSFTDISGTSILRLVRSCRWELDYWEAPTYLYDKDTDLGIRERIILHDSDYVILFRRK